MRVLVVEDSATQLAELQALLEHVGFTVRAAPTLAAAVEALQAEIPDIVLLDLGLPDGRGLPVLEAIRRTAPDAPVVILTGTDDEQTAVRAVQQGAQDYLIKGEANDAVLVRCLRYAVERKQHEIALRRSRDDLAAILNQLRVGTMMLDGAGRTTFVSRACEPYLTGSPHDAAGRPWHELLPLGTDDALRPEAMLGRAGTEEDLPPEVVRSGPAAPATGRKRGRDAGPAELSGREQAERDRLLEALRQARGNRTVAAQILGIGRATFYRRLESLNIQLED